MGADSPMLVRRLKRLARFAWLAWRDRRLLFNFNVAINKHNLRVAWLRSDPEAYQAAITASIDGITDEEYDAFMEAING